MPTAATIYVSLPEFAPEMWRPIEADRVGLDWYRIVGHAPAGEVWEFQPGDIVFCEEQLTDFGRVLVAVHKIFDVS